MYKTNIGPFTRRWWGRKNHDNLVKRVPAVLHENIPDRPTLKTSWNLHIFIFILWIKQIKYVWTAKHPLSFIQNSFKNNPTKIPSHYFRNKGEYLLNSLREVCTQLMAFFSLNTQITALKLGRNIFNIGLNEMTNKVFWISSY